MPFELFFNKPVSGAFSGSFIADETLPVGFIGTASWAEQAVSASFVVSASHALLADSASFVVSASHALLADSASFAVSASHAVLADSASLAASASWATKSTVAPALINFNNIFGAEILLTVPSGGMEEPDSGARVIFDLTGYSQSRMIVRVPPRSPSLPAGWLAPQFLAVVSASNEDNNAAWSFLNGTTEPSISLDTSGTITSPWTNITPSAQTDVFLRWVVFSGSAATGSTRPAVTSINLNIR